MFSSLLVIAHQSDYRAAIEIDGTLKLASVAVQRALEYVMLRISIESLS